MLDEILLYDHSDSPFCLKARICLRLKGVPFRRVTVTAGRRRELRRLNPNSNCGIPRYLVGIATKGEVTRRESTILSSAGISDG